MPQHQTKSKIAHGLEILLNSPDSPMYKNNREQLLSSPSAYCIEAAEGKKKKKDEDKERSKNRMNCLNSV